RPHPQRPEGAGAAARARRWGSPPPELPRVTPAPTPPTPAIADDLDPGANLPEDVRRAITGAKHLLEAVGLPPFAEGEPGVVLVLAGLGPRGLDGLMMLPLRKALAEIAEDEPVRVAVERAATQMDGAVEGAILLVLGQGSYYCAPACCLTSRNGGDA